ncbi:hypothetical protein [Sphingomonas sp. PP-CE-1G-424]|uniref:hypothetical protein n=1 Tax=Sphingomonas sp. PP-CE-1G-424 TaxID=2135658 RepID=UPI0010561EBD|nr:hypothetical protein [Sphingomonas sp. PP-CE-1G-424]
MDSDIGELRNEARMLRFATTMWGVVTAVLVGAVGWQLAGHGDMLSALTKALTVTVPFLTVATGLLAAVRWNTHRRLRLERAERRAIDRPAASPFRSAVVYRLTCSVRLSPVPVGSVAVFDARG